jgi:ubiquinone/menaquinone biosynthesis C-methylase UbiE
MFFTLSLLVGLALVWFGWRRYSRRTLLPCPSEFSWLVEVENPLARATRSEQIVRRLALPAGARVADIGCGPGRVTLPLARAVGEKGEVFALDLQPEMLAKVAEKAARENLPQVRLVPSDAREQHLPREALDAAVMVMALGEVPAPERALAEVFRALKPGGRLLVAESVFDPHYIRAARLRAMAAAAGFEESSHTGNRFAYNIVFGKPPMHQPRSAPSSAVTLPSR